MVLQIMNNLIESGKALQGDTNISMAQIEINPKHRVTAQVKFGRPIEDAEPLLDREEFLANMIVKPVEASLR
jgi:acetolactate synthase-1/2/3 large subunit